MVPPVVQDFGDMHRYVTGSHESDQKIPILRIFSSHIGVDAQL